MTRHSYPRYDLDPKTTEESCQRVWIDLSQRMQSFRYDPDKTFRSWLLRLCLSRPSDLLRKKKLDAVLSLEDYPAAWWREDATGDFNSEEWSWTERPFLLRLAEEVPDHVRRRVDDRTWQIFSKIAVLGHTIREPSTVAGMSYYVAFAARKRGGRMLREEGQRLLCHRRANERGPGDPRHVSPPHTPREALTSRTRFREGKRGSPRQAGGTRGRSAANTVISYREFAPRGEVDFGPPAAALNANTTDDVTA